MGGICHHRTDPDFHELPFREPGNGRSDTIVEVIEIPLQAYIMGSQWFYQITMIKVILQSFRFLLPEDTF